MMNGYIDQLHNAFITHLGKVCGRRYDRTGSAYLDDAIMDFSHLVIARDEMLIFTKNPPKVFVAVDFEEASLRNNSLNITESLYDVAAKEGTSDVLKSMGGKEDRHGRYFDGEDDFVGVSKDFDTEPKSVHIANVVNGPVNEEPDESFKRKVRVANGDWPSGMEERTEYEEEQPDPDGEKVNHPEHYGGDTVYEVIKVLEAWLSPEQFIGACRGQAMIYLARADKKGHAEEDLRKAQRFIEFEHSFRRRLPIGLIGNERAVLREHIESATLEEIVEGMRHREGLDN